MYLWRDSDGSLHFIYQSQKFTSVPNITLTSHFVTRFLTFLLKLYVLRDISLDSLFQWELRCERGHESVILFLSLSEVRVKQVVSSGYWGVVCIFFLHFQVNFENMSLFLDSLNQVGWFAFLWIFLHMHISSLLVFLIL